ncbi:restriction endonuclease subunit S [Rhodococcus gordoniae]|uniref:restriction endonuclease subunit S n=1 Tax=Rhodococcus gordoniae TaxID=223392 RepID=UPI001428ACC8
MADWGSGGTPSRSNPEFYGGDIPWATIADLTDGPVLSTGESITRAALASSSAKLVPEGSVLVAMYGSIGKLGIPQVPMATNQAIAFATPRQGVLDRRFLFHFLRAQRRPLLAAGRGGTQANISQTILKSWQIPLPPLSEQCRIASILDHADTLRAKRREAIARLDELTQSIFIDMFGDPVVNRKAFPVVPLTQVGHLYSGGTPSKATPDNWEGFLPWFSPKDLKRDDLFDSQDHINERITDRTSLKLLPPDTVVFVVRGMILAHSFPVSILRVQATINQDMKAVLPSVDVTSNFLAHNLRVQTNNILAQVSTAGHGTKRLDFDGMSRIPVLLPPIELQREFDARIELIRHLRTRHQVALSSVDMLFSSLQARLFCGAL